MGSLAAGDAAGCPAAVPWAGLAEDAPAIQGHKAGLCTSGGTRLGCAPRLALKEGTKRSISISWSAAACFASFCISARQAGFVRVRWALVCVCARNKAAKIHLFLCPESLPAEDCCRLGRRALARPLGTGPEL